MSRNENFMTLICGMRSLAKIFCTTLLVNLFWQHFAMVLMWMRSSRMVRASGCQCQSRNSPGFDPASSGTVECEGAADEAVLNNVHKNKNPKVSLVDSYYYLNRRSCVPVYIDMASFI
jgi:hypothetical protein